MLPCYPSTKHRKSPVVGASLGALITPGAAFNTVPLCIALSPKHRKSPFVGRVEQRDTRLITPGAAFNPPKQNPPTYIEDRAGFRTPRGPCFVFGAAVRALPRYLYRVGPAVKHNSSPEICPSYIYTRRKPKPEALQRPPGRNVSLEEKTLTDGRPPQRK